MCEQHLRSRAPSELMLRTALERVCDTRGVGVS
jgi:hypothetical protein